MNVTVNREGNDATLKITVPAADVAKGYKSAVQRIASQVKIPGFRPGKAPRNVIEMHYGKEAVKEEAFNVVVNRAYQTALTQEKLMPVSDPSVNDEKAAFDSFEEGKDLNLEIKVTLKPEPELGEYKGLHVDKKDAAVSDEDVDKALDELRNRGAKMVDTADDTIIEKGDFAVIDFAGTVDGEPFSGGEGKGYPLEVGSGSFIWPVPNYKYVSRWMGNGHRGADICAAYGTPILASDSGTIIAAGWHYSYGNYVEIDHGNGYKTLYGHMSSIAVSQGQAVTQGQVIGYVGSTGNSTGNHCHFEMSYNGALFSAYTLFSDM